MITSKSELDQRKSISKNPNISFLSRNDLKTTTVQDIRNGFKSQIFDDFQRPNSPRAWTNLDQWFEYIKIAEWCNNSCSFCIIPQIRWKQQSLPIPKILQEVQNLVHAGCSEIILIAQDSTRYGTDLYGKPQLFELLAEIEKVPWDFMYRVLYLYPDLLTKKQIEKLTKFTKFIPYFDLPFQHISAPILKSMWRFYDSTAIHKFLDFIKSSFPVHFIRTNFIIWFPWETSDDIQKLHDFIAKNYFDNIALFEYHDEPLASSSKLPNKVPDLEIHKRFLAFRRQVNQLLLSRSEKRKGKEEIWFIQEYIYQDNKTTPLTRGEGAKPKTERKRDLWTITIRPRLHCPDIDELDDITSDQIIQLYSKKLEIWTKVKYIIP